MFRNRKRKVSPDKKSDKSKKLKVSSKIFRSPSSTKTNSEAKLKLSKLLPEGYDSILLTANIKPVESFEENEAVFGCVRLPILTKEDAMVWVKKFERKTFTSYRTQRTWKKDVNTGLFKRKYICNVRHKDVAGQSTVSTCKGSIIFTIKDQEEIQANPDYYLRDYPSQVIIHFCHNHKIDPDSYMKNLRPSAELRIIFGTYFAKGHSPFSALICHKCDLHSLYGAEFYNVVSNGAICPSYNWCFYEYEKFFMRKFIEPPEEKLNEKLTEAVNQYNTKWRSECAIVSYNPLFVISICTPLMKSIFRSGFAEELITVRCFSTPKTVPKRQKLILFLSHTPIGSLPFGVVVTFAEDIECICEGISALIKMFGVPSYSPKTIIIDENALLSKALKRTFPQAQVLFNEFQMLQSIWRINRAVCCDDDEEFQALYNLFLVTLNSSSEEEFKKNFDSLLIYAEKYPKLTNFLKYFRVRSNSYVLYARPKIEFNTDVLNYTDSGTIILQDVSIKYGNFFNIVQLFDFVSKSYVDHYERKLTKIVEGDLKGFFKTNFYVPLSKIADFTCEKISDTEFLISLNDMKFFVNAELDTCTCQVGVHGGSCVHQYIVEKNLGLVPECYTPLCDDMLEIFKNILREKNIKPPLPDNDRLSELGTALDSLKSELEPCTEDPDDFSDIVSSVCGSEISNFSEMPHDMDHLGPLDEIYLVPPDINDSFTDIRDEAMSPLVLSEFDDTTNEDNEDSEDFFDDSQQYNRESGELELIESSNNTQETNKIRNGVVVEHFPPNPKQCIPTSGLFLNHNTENVIIYEYTEDDIKCNNEVEIVEQCETPDGDSLVHLPGDGSIVLSTSVEAYNITENITCGESRVVYNYSNEKEGQVEFYQDAVTENDRKTAEIAEFLTNLPDTNNSNYILTTSKQHGSPSANIMQNLSDTDESLYKTTTTSIPDQEGLSEKEQIVSNGVVVVKNEEYFTNYKVLKDNVLSVETKVSDEYTDDVKLSISNSVRFGETSQQGTQSLITDSYEDNNFIMMSPNDLFDDTQNVESDTDKQEGKINVLSSVVIKPPASENTLNLPLNLNIIKHKTLRNVKEDNRLRMNEQRSTQFGNTIFVHDPLESEPRKIVLPVINKQQCKDSSNPMENENTNEDKYNYQTHEKDVIKLYCNQSGEKSLVEENGQNETTLFRDVFLDKISVDVGSTEDRLVEKQLHIQKQAHLENDFQEFEEVLDAGFQAYDKEVPSSEETVLVTGTSKDDPQKCDQGASDHDIDYELCDKNVLDSDEFMLPDCDPEELAKNEFIEIIEIDSDGLEEIASQKYDPPLISPEIISVPTSSHPLLPEKSLKVIPLTTVPSKILPFKTFPVQSAPAQSNCMSLRDFMSKIAPSKVPLQITLSSQTKGAVKAANKNHTPLSGSSGPVRGKSEPLQGKARTSFSGSDTLILNNFKDSPNKYLNEPNINIETLENNITDNLDLNIQENVNSNSNKQIETVKSQLKRNDKKGKSLLSTLKCFAAKNKKVIITHKKATDTSDSEEMSLSDDEDEDFSDSFLSFSSEVDDLSKDELNKSEYLYHDTSDMSDTDLRGSIYEMRWKGELPRKLCVKNLKNPQVLVSPNLQSGDDSSDESVNSLDFSNTRNKRQRLPTKESEETLNRNDTSPDKSINTQVSKTPVFRVLKETNYKNPQDGFDKLTEHISLSNKNSKRVLLPDSQIHTHNIKSQKPERRLAAKNQKMHSLRSTIPRKCKKIITENTTDRNYGENLDDESSRFSDFLVENKKEKDLGQENKQGTSKEVNTDRQYSENMSESGVYISVDKHDESKICTNKDLEDKLHQIRPKINPKILNIKNRKICNTTLKLDSLPSILSQSYNRKVLQNTRELCVNPCIRLPQNNKTYASKSGDNDDEISIKEEDSKDKLLADSSVIVDLPSISSFSHPQRNTSIVGQEKKTLSDNEGELLLIQKTSEMVETKVFNEKVAKTDTRKSFHKTSASREIKDKPFSKLSVTGSKVGKVQNKKGKALGTFKRTYSKVRRIPVSRPEKIIKRSKGILTNNGNVKQSFPKTSQGKKDKLLFDPLLPNDSVEGSYEPALNSSNVATEPLKTIKNVIQIGNDIVDLKVIMTNKEDTKQNLSKSSTARRTKNKSFSGSLPSDGSVPASKRDLQTSLNISMEKAVESKIVKKPVTEIKRKKDLEPILTNTRDTKQIVLKTSLETKRKSFSGAPTFNDFVCASKRNLNFSLNLSTVESTDSKVYQIFDAQKPCTQFRKDIKDLEAILTNDKDVDRDFSSDLKDIESKTHNASIVDNKDLSFLFNDPRFETVVEEELLPASSLVPTNISIFSNILPSPEGQIVGCGFENNRLNLGDNDASKKKFVTNNLFIKDSNFCQKTELVQAGQNQPVAFLIYANVPTPQVSVNTRRPLWRKILPKPEIILNDDQKELNLTAHNVIATKQDAEKTCSSLIIQPQKTDLQQADTLVDKFKTRKNTHLQSSKASNTDRRRRSRVTKNTFTDVENDIKSKPDKLSSVESPNKRDKDGASRETSKGVMHDWLHPRRSSRNEMLGRKTKENEMPQKSSKKVISVVHREEKSNVKKAAAILERKNEKPLSPDKNVKRNSKTSLNKTTMVSLPKKEIFGRRQKSMDHNDKKDTALLRPKRNKPIPPKTIKNNSSFKNETSMLNLSKKETPIRKEKTMYHTEEETNCKKNVTFVKSKNKPQESPNKNVQNDSFIQNTSPSSPTENILKKRKGKFLHKKGKHITVQANESICESFSQSFTAGHSFDCESDDLENSIVASVLEKQPALRKNLKPAEIRIAGPLTSSTPIKSVGYEDAFKKFLETATKWRPKKQPEYSLSDFEKECGDSDWESNGETRRRTKSVSNSTKQKYASITRTCEKIKKSVSWAEGLNIIEYVEESNSDSDDSETRYIPKKNEYARANRKLQIDQEYSKCISNKGNDLTPQRTDQTAVTRCRPQDLLVRLEANETHDESVDRPMSSVSMFQRRRTLTRTNDSFGYRLRQSRSSTSSREKKTIATKRSKSYTRVKDIEPKLIILLEKNKEIDKLCLSLKDKIQEFRGRRRGGRVGYKELLERARLSKNL